MIVCSRSDVNWCHEKLRLHKAATLTSINSGWLRLQKIWGLRRTKWLLLIVITVGKIWGNWAPPTVPYIGESLGMGNSFLERRATCEPRLWRGQVVKFFFLIFKAITIKFLITTGPFFDQRKRYTGTVSWHWCWSWSIVLPQACKGKQDPKYKMVKIVLLLII